MVTLAGLTVAEQAEIVAFASLTYPKLISIKRDARIITKNLFLDIVLIVQTSKSYYNDCMKKKLRQFIKKHHPEKHSIYSRLQKKLGILLRNTYFLLILKTVVFTLILLSGYYFLFLKPKLEIPNALLDARKKLSVHYYTLVENRASYTEFTRLDTTGGNLEYEKGEIIAKIKKTNEEGLKDLENRGFIKKIKGSPSDRLNFLNNDLPKAYYSLLDKNKKIYEEQKNIIESLNKLDSKISKLFAYNPEVDLGKLDLTKDKEQALERSANAKLGLTKIKDEVPKSELSKEIDKTIGLLTQLEDSLKKDSIKESVNVRSAIYNQFGKVKSSALELELAIIKSPESVKILTDQTNLILEYEFWIGKIKK